MPFIRDESDFEFDMDAAEEEIEAARAALPFGYLTPQQYGAKRLSFDPKALTGVAAAAMATVLATGFMQFRVNYDGGHDEGFAHGDAFIGKDGKIESAKAVAARLGSKDSAALRAAVTGPQASHWDDAASYYAKLSDTDVVSMAFDELADALASALLGDGYGTGEYSMYGAFIADLITGQMIDDPRAEQPPTSTFT
ncbi:MAG: hypothetical protein JWM57_616 [Phycisphaerales bacterium]|nr:hypothetical protein [Phycisphaerales bacterium]